MLSVAWFVIAVVQRGSNLTSWQTKLGCCGGRVTRIKRVKLGGRYSTPEWRNCPLVLSCMRVSYSLVGEIALFSLLYVESPLIALRH